MVEQLDEKLLIVVARAAEKRVSEFRAIVDDNLFAVGGGKL